MFFISKSRWASVSLRLGARSALCAGLALGACAAPPAPTQPQKIAPKLVPVASADSTLSPEPPMPQIRAVALTAATVPGTVELTLSARGQDGAFEVLQLEAPPQALSATTWQRNDVHLDEAGLPYAFLSQEAPNNVTRLWVRRPLRDTARELSGDIYTAGSGIQAGLLQHFHAALPERKLDPKLETRWVSALADHLASRRGPFYAFAANQMRTRLPASKAAPVTNAYESSAGELARMIGTTTGRSSVQEALLRKPSLYAELARGQRKIPIGNLSAPRVTRHPWSAMLAQLPQKPTVEVMAKATPAAFYYVRVRDFATFLDLSDVSESWGSPLLDLLDGKVQDRGLREHYETELALEHTELARTFGPTVIEEMAIVGSDPYLVEGSDLTLIFRVKSGLLFDAALLKSLAAFSVAHPGVDTQKLSVDGVEVAVSSSSDGQIRRHRASVDGYELVSNSTEAVRRVIAAIRGKAPRLADEPDFSYMLARDADQPAPVLAFAGDRFVETVIGPQQKLKAAERELSLADVSRPGYAALLYGLLNGHAPTSTADLVQAKLLAPADLAPGGVAAGWQPGMAAHTSRGSTLGMLPVLDAPELTLVTASEQQGYDYFARDYENEWSEYVDPFVLRVSRTQPAQGATTLDAELRVLPVLRREYRELTQQVGRARVLPGALPEGLRVLLGVGQDSELRHLLSHASRSFMGHEFSFDWLGEYAFVGVADRNELAEAARFRRAIDPGGPEFARDYDRDREEDLLAKVPAYAGVAIRSSTATAIALGLLKKVGDEATPGTLLWSEVRKHRGIALMSVHSTDDGESKYTLYYALTPHALLFSLNADVLETVIDQYVDGKAPQAASGKPSERAAQLVVDLKGKQQGALYTVLSWLLTQNLQHDELAVASADALFRGAPELTLDPAKAARVMRNYFGSVPLSLEGRPYGFGVDGVQDPLRGSGSSPKWPILPVPGSPIAKVLARLSSVRSQISFDDEPSGGRPGAAPQSLRVHLTVSLH